MNFSFWLLLFCIATAAILSVKTKKLTPAAAVVGCLLSICIYIGAGVTGIAMLALFFLLSTAATSWQMKTKQASSIAEKNSGRREWTQVIANAGVAAIIGLVSYLFTSHSVLWHVMMAAAFSSATADTLSSELGNVWGKNYYNIITFRKDKRGLDGVISREGTLAGIAGSLLIAIVYCIGFTANLYLFVVIILSGTIGNLADSVLGAAFERKGFLNNDAVNFLNTLVGALAAFLLF